MTRTRTLYGGSRTISRQSRSWVYKRAKYITAEVESARFSCFDTNRHLEQDELPVTKDVNQRVMLSRLTAEVFQQVENQGFWSNLMSSDVLSSVLIDIQDQPAPEPHAARRCAALMTPSQAQLRDISGPAPAPAPVHVGAALTELACRAQRSSYEALATARFLILITHSEKAESSEISR